MPHVHRARACGPSRLHAVQQVGERNKKGEKMSPIVFSYFKVSTEKEKEKKRQSPRSPQQQRLRVPNKYILSKRIS